MTRATGASIRPRAGQLSVSVGLAGLGGDVRTYQPSLEYTQFFRVRNKEVRESCTYSASASLPERSVVSLPLKK